MPRWILLRMRNDKFAAKIGSLIVCWRKKKSRKSCRLWDNMAKCGRTRQATGDNIIRRMRSAFWIPKATNTHSEYAIPVAFPLQQCLKECASMLCSKYIVYILVISCYWYISKYVSWVISSSGFRSLLSHMFIFCSTNNEGSRNKCPFTSNSAPLRDSECSAFERLHTKHTDSVRQIILTAVPNRGRQLKCRKQLQHLIWCEVFSYHEIV